MGQQAEQFESALLAMDRLRARRILEEHARGGDFLASVESLVVPVLEDIGEKWERGELALAQVYMSGRICEELVDLHLPPASPLRTNQPTMAIVVLEDFHTLGKLMVYSALRASGLELIDLGQADVSETIAAVIAHDVRILMVSVLMYPSALRIQELVERLTVEHPGTRVIVGGAPFRFEPHLFETVGAHAVGADTAEALQLAQRFVLEAS